MEREEFLKSLKYTSTSRQDIEEKKIHMSPEMQKFYEEVDELFKKELGKSVFGNDFDTRFSR